MKKREWVALLVTVLAVVRKKIFLVYFLVTVMGGMALDLLYALL